MNVPALEIQIAREDNAWCFKALDHATKEIAVNLESESILTDKHVINETCKVSFEEKQQLDSLWDLCVTETSQKEVVPSVSTSSSNTIKNVTLEPEKQRNTIVVKEFSRISQIGGKLKVKWMGDLIRKATACVNRRWESGMRVNILDFAGDTLSPQGFIDWLVAVEEVFDFKEFPENKRVSLIATKLRGRASAWWQQLKLTR
ncbi:hypothetical protein Tco_0675193 [Tanacetum coccineum]